MKTEIPEKYRKAADGGEFLIFKDLVDQDQPLVIFMSQWAVGVLRNHRTWMFDVTFPSAPGKDLVFNVFVCNTLSVFNLT